MIARTLFVATTFVLVAAAEQTVLPPMLNLPRTGTNPTEIDFAALPVLAGTHGVVSKGEAPWIFRLHSYLAHFDGKFWCMWSHGPVAEDRPTQHVRYSTSVDGLNWSRDEIIAPPPTGGERFISRGLWIREGQLFALATLDNQPAAKAAKSRWGPDLRLLGFEWNAHDNSWNRPIVVFPDTLSNFPPQKLPDGSWAMTRRDHYGAVSMLIGGRESISNWKVHATAAEGSAHPDFVAAEPDWYLLPNGNAIALYRDRGGSKRLFRAISTDRARTWSRPEQTNFPDARSKFYVHPTTAGFYVLVSNANPSGRNPLCLAVSDDGLTFTRLAQLPIPADRAGLVVAPEGKRGTVQYPHVIEHGGALFISFSRNDTSIEVVRVTLDEVARLRNQP